MLFTSFAPRSRLKGSGLGCPGSPRLQGWVLGRFGEAGTPSQPVSPPLASFPAALVPTSQVTLPGHFRGMVKSTQGSAQLERLNNIHKNNNKKIIPLCLSPTPGLVRPGGLLPLPTPRGLEGA